MDVFCVGRIEKSICYSALLGGMMMFISPLSKVSCCQIPTSDNNFEMDSCLMGTHLGI